MSVYQDVPNGLVRTSGKGIFSDIGKVFKSAPILSTGLALAPQTRFLAPVAASMGLGKPKRKQTKQAGGRIDFAKLAKASLPLLKETKLVSKAASKVPIGGKVLESLAKSQGFGKGKGKGKGKKQNRK